MTSPNQTPDALREIIADAIDDCSDSIGTITSPPDELADHILTAISPFQAREAWLDRFADQSLPVISSRGAAPDQLTPPPLTPDASTTEAQPPEWYMTPPPSQGAEGRTPRTEGTEAVIAVLEQMEAQARKDGRQYLWSPSEYVADLSAQLASARAELAEAMDELHNSDERLNDMLRKYAATEQKLRDMDEHAMETIKNGLEAQLKQSKEELTRHAPTAAEDTERIDWLENTNQRGHYCGDFRGNLITRAAIDSARSAAKEST